MTARPRCGPARHHHVAFAVHLEGSMRVRHHGGEVIKTVPESEIVATLIEEANRLAAEMAPGELGSPDVVTV